MTMQAVEVEDRRRRSRSDGDRINAVLAAAGYNFSLLLRWFEELLRVLSSILWHALLAVPLHLTRCSKIFFTADSVGLAQPGGLRIARISYPNIPTKYLIS